MYIHECFLLQLVADSSFYPDVHMRLTLVAPIPSLRYIITAKYLVRVNTCQLTADSLKRGTASSPTRPEQKSLDYIVDVFCHIRQDTSKLV